MISKQRSSQCLEIIHKILKHKISRPFLYPIDFSKPEFRKFKSIIQHPTDLSTVKSNLENNKYEHFSDFFTDVNLIWENAKIIYKNTCIFYMATQLQMIFYDLTALMSDNEDTDWTTQLNVLFYKFDNVKDKLNDYLKNMKIKKIQNRMKFNGRNSCIKESNKTEDKKPKKLSKDDLDGVFNYILNNLNDENTVFKIISIINQNESLKLDEESEVNLCELKECTIEEIIKVLKE